MGDESDRGAKPRGLWSVLEGASRHFSMILFAGATAMVVGRLISSSILAALVDGRHAVPFVVEWLIVQLWVLAVLPPIGWLAGRFMRVSALGFGLVATLAGELLSALMTTAVTGLEGLYPSVEDTVARAVSLAVGLLLTMVATQRGLDSAAAKEAAAVAWAALRKTEYEARLGPVAPPEAGSQPATASGDGDGSSPASVEVAADPTPEHAKPPRAQE